MSDRDLIKIQAEGKEVELKVSTGQMVFNNFLSGLAWGFGTVIGATFVVALLFYLLGQLNTAPVIGSYINDILNHVQKIQNAR